MLISKYTIYKFDIKCLDQLLTHIKKISETFTRFSKCHIADLYTVSFSDQFKSISILLFAVKMQVYLVLLLCIHIHHIDGYMIFLMENLFSNFPTYYCITYGNDSKLDLFRNCVVFLTPFNMANTGVKP